jgi:transposase
MAAVALERGLNANLLRRWVQEAERGDAPIAIRPANSTALAAESDGFIPVSLPASAPDSPIQIELRVGAKRLTLQWPASQAQACALLLRALMK